MNGSWFSICKSYQVASFIKLLDCLKKKKKLKLLEFFFFLRNQVTRFCISKPKLSKWYKFQPTN